jgi:type 1 glutamine amidotransferase
MRAYAALSNNACFTFIDAIDPKGTLNDAFYKRAGQINEEFSRYEKYLSADAEELADVVIYYSFDSSFSKDSKVVDIKDFNSELSDYFRNQNIIKALNGAHLNFTFASRRDLSNLQKYPLLILPDESILDAEEISAIKDYVRNGGKLYASFHTSLYDKKTGCLKDFLLAELFGAHFTGKETPAITYLSPVPGSPLLEFCSADYPLMLDSKQLILEADTNAEVLATLTLPYTDPADCAFFGSAISNPPGISTSHPAMLRKRYGRGEIIYVAGDLEGLPYNQHRRVLTALLLELLDGKTMIKTNAPATTEITVFKHQSRKELVISLLNLPAELPPVPIYNMKFELAVPGIIPRAILTAPDELPLEFCCNSPSGKIEFVLDKLEKFCMLILKYE